MLTAYAGDWERGCTLSEQARKLNPHHPGWYWFPPVFDAYRKGDYRGALEIAQNINLPGFWRTNFALAAIYGQLGELEQARKAVQALLSVRPDFATTAREECSKWWQPEFTEKLLEGLHKAGLETDRATSISGSLRTPDSGASRTDEGFWVAVLPFKSAGASEEIRGLADGLSEEIVAGLSRFSYLRVITYGSTHRYADQSSDPRVVGKELGARYVMTGNLRQVGARLRVAAQLVDATTGAQLWSETYERPFNAEEVFELQDELVPRIVSTAADMHGVLPRSMSAVVRGKPSDQLTPYEALLRGFGHSASFSPDDIIEVHACLDRALQQSPNNADCQAMLAIVQGDAYGFSDRVAANTLDGALHAARAAVEAAPTNALAYHALAKVSFFKRNIPAFRAAAERAILLNPMDGATIAYMGILIAFSGDWKRGCPLTEKGMQLNANHPGWHLMTAWHDAYRRKDYLKALELALKLNAPKNPWVQRSLTVTYAQLGSSAEARSSLHDLLALVPNYARVAREMHSRWLEPELVEHMIDGLRKAGLEIADEQSPTVAKSIVETSGTARSDNLSIAVLPFANMSADKEQEYFSDGLAEEIINLLAQMAGLKVIARTSSFAFRGKEQDIRKIAETLNVTHILEGSVRRAGNHIRITAQLIAAEDGSHLWSERYDRELSDIFAVQDEISSAIASALRVKFAQNTAPQRYVPKVAAYEAYLKARYLQAKVTPESLELAKRCFEQAIELDPAFAMAHVGLGFYWCTLTHFGRYPAHQSVPAAQAAVRRALQIDPSLPDAHALMGYLAAMYDMDWAAAEKHFDFPMAKEAGFALIRPMYSGFQFLRGNVDQAIKLAQHAIEEDPLEVWARMNLHAYLQAAGRDNEALEQLKKVLELDGNQVVAMVSMAMILADKGELAEALVIARRAYAIGRWFQDTIGVLAALLLRNGEKAEAQSLAKSLGSGEALDDARAHAIFHLLCGEVDQGADWVEKAIQQRDPSMMFYLRFVVCKGLRAGHRWAKIAKMVNLPLGA
jgi:serine/threonine-protein kinase